MQWAFGRDLEEDHQDLATWSAASDPASMMFRNLQCRLDMEAFYRKLQADSKISRALNSRPERNVQYLPGDLVYYRRVKHPKDSSAHALIKLPQGRRFRWYGPAQVLAAETRVHAEGESRVAGNTAWLVANGRLKKAHTSQLRHASERERLVAEANLAPTMPWTFTSLGGMLDQGQYEDLLKEEAKATQSRRRERRGRSHSRGGERAKVPRLERPRDGAGMPIPDDSEEELIPDGDQQQPEAEDASDLDIDRLLNDPSYLPLKRLPEADLQERREAFLRARREHEATEWPLRGARESTNVVTDAAHWCHEEDNDWILGVKIDIPKDASEWKKVLKHPDRFVAKSVSKGAEVFWERLNPVQREAMLEAKKLEVSQWIARKVCKRVEGVADADSVGFSVQSSGRRSYQGQVQGSNCAPRLHRPRPRTLGDLRTDYVQTIQRFVARIGHASSMEGI